MPVLPKALSHLTMASAPSFKLNTGATIPAIGLGTWQAKPGEVQQAVAHALRVGYRHLDCALCYQVHVSVRSLALHADQVRRMRTR
jgi:diketogulonate reductase-like aldo/keto reductase